jgi:hypothetical protein
MTSTRTTNILLLLVVIALAAIAARPWLVPAPAQADTAGFYPVVIEPGTQMLRTPDGTRQVYGRVIVDLTNGKIWGFPTTTTAVYPIDVSNPKPPVSHPFLLGTFDFQDMTRSQ